MNSKSLLLVPQLNGFRWILKDSERTRLEYFVYIYMFIQVSKYKNTVYIYCIYI